MKDHISHYKAPAPPLLTTHNFQPETADEHRHLTTAFWLLAPLEDSCPLSAVAAQELSNLLHMKEHQQLQILKCHTKLGVVSLLSEQQLYNSVVFLARNDDWEPRRFLVLPSLQQQIWKQWCFSFQTFLFKKQKQCSKHRNKNHFLPPPGPWLPWPPASVPVPPLAGSICRIPRSPCRQNLSLRSVPLLNPTGRSSGHDLDFNNKASCYVSRRTEETCLPLV